MSEHHHESEVRREREARPAEARDDERQHAEGEIAARLRDRGVHLTGRESGDDLADLLDAVERFEAAVENNGGDLMVDEPIGTKSPIEPDDEAFVLPRRNDGESVDAFIERVAVATNRAMAKRAD